jgi:rod shape-determining protein MreD
MYYFAIPLVLLVALIEASVLPSFGGGHAGPDLTLVLLSAWAVLRGPEEAMVLVPMGGVCLDLLGPAPLGVAVIALAPIVLLALVNDLGLINSELVVTIFVTMLGTILFYTIEIAVLDVAGYADASFSVLVASIFPGLLVNAAITPVLYFPLRAARRRSRATLDAVPRL